MKIPKLDCCKKIKFTKNKIIYRSRPSRETNFGIKNYYRYYKSCSKCGHFFLYIKKNLENLYNQSYSNNSYGSLKKIKEKFNFINNIKIQKSDNKNRVIRFKKILNNKKKKLLDIGSGLGVFPYSIRNRVDTFLIEKDKKLFRHLKNIFQKKIIGQDIFSSKLLNKYKNNFDFITINKVLEHVYSPDIFLRRCMQFLKVNGILYLEVPDRIAYQFNGKNTEEFFIEHLHVFSKISLKKLLIRNSFKIKEIKSIREKSGKYTIYAFCQKLYS